MKSSILRSTLDFSVGGGTVSPMHKIIDNIINFICVSPIIVCFLRTMAFVLRALLFTSLNNIFNFINTNQYTNNPHLNDRLNDVSNSTQIYTYHTITFHDVLLALEDTQVESP